MNITPLLLLGGAALFLAQKPKKKSAKKAEEEPSSAPTDAPTEEPSDIPTKEPTDVPEVPEPAEPIPSGVIIDRPMYQPGATIVYALAPGERVIVQRGFTLPGILVEGSTTHHPNVHISRTPDANNSDLSIEYLGGGLPPEGVQVEVVRGEGITLGTTLHDIVKPLDSMIIEIAEAG